MTLNRTLLTCSRPVAWAVWLITGVALVVATPQRVWAQPCGTMQDLGTLGLEYTSASATSADGSVVVGRYDTAASGVRAFRWTEAGGMQDLGTLGGSFTQAADVSADVDRLIAAHEEVDAVLRYPRQLELTPI